MAQSGSMLGRLTRYGIVGLATNLAAYVVFLGFLWSGLAPAIASGVTYVLTVCASYAGNRKWSFKSTASHRRDVPRYVFAYGTGLIVAMGSMYILASWMRPEIAQILVIGTTAGVIFAVLEILKFGK